MLVGSHARRPRHSRVYIGVYQLSVDSVVHSRVPDHSFPVDRPIISSLSPPAFDRGPVVESDHRRVELLDRRRIQFLTGVIEIFVGFDKVREGSVDDNRVRWIVGLTGGNDPFGPVEKVLTFISKPEGRPFRRSHYIPVYALGGLERFPRVVGR